MNIWVACILELLWILSWTFVCKFSYKHVFTSLGNVAGSGIIGFCCTNFSLYEYLIEPSQCIVHIQEYKLFFVYVSEGLGEMESFEDQTLVTESSNSSLWSTVVRSKQVFPKCGSQRTIVFVHTTQLSAHFTPQVFKNLQSISLTVLWCYNSWCH